MFATGRIERDIGHVVLHRRLVVMFLIMLHCYLTVSWLANQGSDLRANFGYAT